MRRYVPSASNRVSSTPTLSRPAFQGAGMHPGGGPNRAKTISSREARRYSVGADRMSGPHLHKESSTMRTQLVAALAALAVLGSAACAANPVVVIETSLGNIKVELNEEKAPVTVKNFLKYVDDKHYNGTVFHPALPTF